MRHGVIQNSEFKIQNWLRALGAIMLIAAQGTFLATPSQAQTIGEAFYIYRNDGEFNAFFRSEVERIDYSCYDLDSLLHDDIQTQVVYTADSVYRIPLTAIDSVSFVTPETEYKTDVLRMDESWLSYVVSVGDNSITFRSDTPMPLLPTIGQVIVSETFEEPLTMGFSGRVIGRETTSGGITFTVDEIGLSDIYDHIVRVGISSSYDENEVRGNAPRRLWGYNPDKGARFPIGKLDVTVGPLGISADVSVLMKYIVCVGEKNLKDYVSIQTYTAIDGSLSLSVKREGEYHPEPKWKLSKDFPTEIPGLYGRIRAGGFFRADGSVNLSLTQPFAVNGYSSFVKAEGQRSQRSNEWTTTMNDLEAEVSLDGKVSMGVAVQLQFGIIHEKIASADITSYVGPQLSGNFTLNSNGIVENTLYSSIKDSKIDLDFGVDVVPGYRFWGSDEHHELPVSLNRGININRWYIVPEFKNLSYENRGPSGLLSGDIERNLLPKVSLGWVLYDEQEQVYRKEYFAQTYRKIEDWPYDGLEQQISDLPSGKRFKAYPLVKLLGVEMRGNEGVDIDTEFPVTLSDFRVTKSQYKKGGFTNDGIAYDYRFDVSVTASIDTDDLSQIADWGYAYLDPNGREALISLRQYGTEYTDTRYAYFRDEAHSTATLYGYVKYVGSDEIVYGEPEDYELDYEGEHTCPDNNHPHMIDLGIGTLWACCNVGASSPEQYGNYYAWGETQPKSVYTWDTYQYYNDNTGIVNIGSDISGTSYDAARANWGAPWRMPTLAECQALLNQCTSEWTTLNGVYGRKFTGPNGGTIFLPAAGRRWGGELSSAGAYGDYWSSTLDESGPYYACYLSFDSGYANWYNGGNRTYGRSVRPVR